MDEYELIELKLGVGNQHPLGAALQLAEYGCLYLHARRNRERMGLDLVSHPVLSARRIHMQVLAPATFYEQYRSRQNITQILEREMENGFRDLLEQSDELDVSFGFIKFPSGFTWPAASDDDLIEAIRNRSTAFT